MPTNRQHRDEARKQRRDEARKQLAQERAAAAAARPGSRFMDTKTLEAESDNLISRYTWRAWMQAGRLPFVRVGRRTLVERETFEAVIRAGRVPARAE
jgi:excisionase family DNA binding protein